MGELFAVTVDHVLQLFAGLEERNLLGRNFNPVSGLGIATHARFTLADAEAAKSPDFDLIASAQRTYHALEDGLNYDLAVFSSELRPPGNIIDQVCLGHLARPLSRNESPAYPHNGYSQFCRGVGKPKFSLDFLVFVNGSKESKSDALISSPGLPSLVQSTSRRSP